MTKPIYSASQVQASGQIETPMRPNSPPWRERLGALGLRTVGRSYCSLLFLFRELRGLDASPGGAKILALNHPNASDVFHLFAAIPGLVSLAQADLFEMPILGWLFKTSGQIPVDDSRKKQAFEQGCEALRREKTLMIFPEGILNPGGEKRKAGTGAVRMSIETGAPVIPVGVHVDQRNTILFRLRSKTRDARLGRWQFRGRFHLQAGEAWYPAREQAGHPSPSVADLTETLMARIRILAQQAEQGAALPKVKMKIASRTND